MRIPILFLSFIFSVSVAAQDYTDYNLLSVSVPDLLDTISGTKLQIDDIQLNQLRSERSKFITFSVPVDYNGTEVSLILERKHFYPESGLPIHLSSGSTVYYNSAVFYQGDIQGENGSTSIVTITNNSIDVILQRGNKEIQKIKRLGDEDYRLFSEDALPTDNSIMGCSIGHHDKYSLDNSYLKNNDEHCNTAACFCENTDHNGCDMLNWDPNNLCTDNFNIGVYYEFDHFAFLTEGDVESSVDYIMTLHNPVNTVYDNILNTNNNGNGVIQQGPTVDMQIGGIYIWNTPDHYPIATLDERLSEFRRSRVQFEGDVAVLLSNFTPGRTGTAYINCLDTGSQFGDQANANQGPYTVVMLGGLNDENNGIPDDQLIFETQILVHEIGHLLGGRHTSSCYWYETGSGNNCSRFAIENDCDNSDCCVDGNNTIPNGQYDPTVMSNCFLADIESPFHRLVAIDIITNLCILDQNGFVFNGDGCIDLLLDADGDGFCFDDPLECDDENPNIPHIIGQPCDDGNPTTFNDRYVDDNLILSDQYTCTCAGDPWFNAGCNIIQGGNQDFEDLCVGVTRSRNYNDLYCEWNVFNPPDIGGRSTGPNQCNNFILLRGRGDDDPNIIAERIEGFALPLTNPIPCGTGRINMNFEIAAAELAAGPTNRSLIAIQGSQIFQEDLPEFGPTNDVHLFQHPIIYPQACVVDVQDFNARDFTDICRGCDDPLVFCDITDLNLLNTSNLDVNFLYVAINPDNNDNSDDVRVMLDNISIELLEESYRPVEIHVTDSDDCYLEVEVHYSGTENGAYCTYRLEQQSQFGDWVTIPSSDILSFDQGGNGHTDPVTGYKFLVDTYEIEVETCFPIRVVQDCPPCYEGHSEAKIKNIECTPEVFDDIMIEGPDFACIGFEHTLQVNPDDLAFEYEWSMNTNPPRDQNGVSVSSNETGFRTYTVTVTDNDSGCEINLDHSITYVACNPELNFFCGNDSAWLTAGLANCDTDSNALGYFINWYELINGNPVVIDVPGNPIQISVDHNGTYCYEVGSLYCGIVKSEEVVVDCFNNGLLCPEPHDYHMSALVSDQVSDHLIALQSNPVNTILFGTFEEVCDQTIIVTGEIFIDENVRFKNCTIFFEDGGKIKTSGGNIWLFGSTLQACENQWEGIHVETGDYAMSTVNSTIRDARSAIKFSDGSGAFLFDTEFINNTTGLDVTGTIFNSGMNNLVFRDNFDAIYLYEVDGFRYPFSPFVNLNGSLDINGGDGGITIQRSSNISFAGDIDIRNLDFAAIFIYGESHGAINIAPNPEFFISNCNTGININGCDNGVFNFSSIDMQQIEDIGINISRCGSGLELNFNGDGTLSIADDNNGFIDITDSNFASCTFNNFRYEVTDPAPFATVNNSSRVRFNTIFMDHHDNDQEHIFGLFNSSNIIIENSTIGFLHDGPYIYSELCNNISIRDNVVQYSSDIQANSIELFGVTNAFVCGNIIQNAVSGLVYDFTPTTAMYQNTFQSNEIGLDIFGLGIGEQSHRGNLWTGDDSAARAGSEQIALNSIVEVNTDCNIDFRPDMTDGVDLNIWFPDDPFVLPCYEIVDCHTIDMTNQWTGDFQDDCCQQEGDPCCIPDPVAFDCETLIELLMQYINDNRVTIYQQAYNYGLHQILTQWLQNILGEYQLPLNSLEEDCFDQLLSVLQNDEGEMNQSSVRLIAKARHQLYSYKERKVAESAEIKSLLQQNKNLNDQRNDLDPWTQQSEIEDISAQIETISEAINNISLEKKARKYNHAVDALNLVSSLVPEDLFEEYHLTLLSIESKIVQEGYESIDEEEWNDIIHIAHQCAYEYGYPVYAARSIFQKIGGPLIKAYDDRTQCTPIEYYKSNSTKGEKLSVYPNPVEDLLNLQIESEMENGLIEIFDTNGRIRHFENILKSGTYKIDTRYLNSGLYIIRVRVDEDNYQITKFVKK